MAPCQFRWMKGVNGSRPVSQGASRISADSPPAKGLWSCEKEPLKRLLHWTRKPWCNLSLLSLSNLWISLSGAVCPKPFSIKTRCKQNQQQQQFDSFLDLCTSNSRGGGGARGEKNPLETNTPMKKLRYQNAIPFLMFFLESSSVPSGCGPAANACYRRTKTLKYK